MNQEKIGKFIKEIRKNNNLTQQEFADKYGVTFQAVSKWENARGIPEISILKQICKDFDMTLDELLDGEYSKQQNNKQKKKGIIVIGIILIVFLIVLGIWFLLDKKGNESFEFKTLTSSCNNFNISGNISYNTQKSAIYISNINYCGGEDNTEYDTIECVLYEETKKEKIEISSYVYDKPNKITLEEFLKDVTFVIDNYDKVCKDYSNNTLNLVIKAKLDNKTVNYEIPLSISNDCGK